MRTATDLVPVRMGQIPEPQHVGEIFNVVVSIQSDMELSVSSQSVPLRNWFETVRWKIVYRSNLGNSQTTIVRDVRENQ